MQRSVCAGRKSKVQGKERQVSFLCSSDLVDIASADGADLLGDNVLGRRLGVGCGSLLRCHGCGCDDMVERMRTSERVFELSRALLKSHTSSERGLADLLRLFPISLLRSSFHRTSTPDSAGNNHTRRIYFFAFPDVTPSELTACPALGVGKSRVTDADPFDRAVPGAQSTK